MNEGLESQLIKGECIEVMQSISDKSIDFILCDLPYGTTACKWDEIIPFNDLWEQYNRIIKDNGAIVLTASQPFTTKLIASNISNFKYCWVWDKVSVSNPQLAKKQPLKHHEDVCVFGSGKGRVAYNPQGLIELDRPKHYVSSVSKSEQLKHIQRKEYVQTHTNYPKSIIQFARPAKAVHPTQKPVELFEYLIKTYTNEGDIVLDNCAGSFTTAIAAINTNRKYVCIEQDEEYFQLGKDRVDNHLTNA